MLSETELKIKGYKILTENLGEVEAERFITIIQREQFDYTKWRQENYPDAESVEALSKEAMKFREKSRK